METTGNTQRHAASPACVFSPSDQPVPLQGPGLPLRRTLELGGAPSPLARPRLGLCAGIPLAVEPRWTLQPPREGNAILTLRVSAARPSQPEADSFSPAAPPQRSARHWAEETICVRALLGSHSPKVLLALLRCWEGLFLRCAGGGRQLGGLAGRRGAQSTS